MRDRSSESSCANERPDDNGAHGRINAAGFWEWVGPPRRSPAIQYINPEVPAIEVPAYPGSRYEAVVPDTLDLAERAALAVHGLTAPLNADADYEMYFAARLQLDPPVMVHSFSDWCQMKWQEALPLMRLISGSRLNEQVDQRWMEIVMQMQGPDGVLYQPFAGRTWVTGTSGHGTLPAARDHYTAPYYNGRMLGAIALYYQLTGDERWTQVGMRVVDGLTKQAVDKGDYAYYHDMIFGVNEVTPPDAALPNSWFQMGFAWTAMGLAQFHKVTGYEPALTLSGKLLRCVRDKSGLFERDGKWGGGHFHGHLYSLLAVLEYAMAADDAEMIRFVKTGYECARAKASMKPIVGYVCEVDDPGAFSETCGVADMIALAVKLTAAGAGDYWDDVDRWTRNQLAENQLTSSGWVYDLPKPRPSASAPPAGAEPDGFGQYVLFRDFLASGRVTGPGVSIDKVAERSVGVFASYPSANEWGPFNDGNYNVHSGCCTGNGSRAIYYVWENILHREDGKLRVNLLLNRASPWADVDSFLPYEGRVDVKVKWPWGVPTATQSCGLSVRIPEWVKPEEVKCRVNGAERALSWEGRYAVIGKVEPQDVATLTFPIIERAEKVRIQGKAYILTRKGNDVVHIDPPGQYGPLYQREKYRENQARTRKVERFVAGQRIDW